MKTNLLFLISTCMCYMFLLTACELQGIHRPLASGEYEQKILPRGDCILCPDADECCCSVSLQPTASLANINICGSINGGAGTCPLYQVGICEESAGISSTHNLTTNMPRAQFCSMVDGPLCIQNLSTTDIARIIISCQVGVLNPDTVWLQIPASTTVCFQTDDGCELEPCQ